MSKSLLTCTICHHSWLHPEAPKGSIRCPSCHTDLQFIQTATYLNLSDCDPDVARIVEAAVILANVETKRQEARASIRWKEECANNHDGMTTCRDEAEDFVAPADDPFATHPECDGCKANRDRLNEERSLKVKRRQAMNRVMRAVARKQRRSGVTL